MNIINPPPEQFDRIKSMLICLAAFILTAVLGLWIHINVLPLPIKSLAGTVARYVYFLIWLGLLIHLMGRVIYGIESRLLHLIVFLPLGAFLGFFGGYFFAGFLGMAIGLISGILLGTLILVLRQFIHPRPNSTAHPATAQGSALGNTHIN